MKRRLIGPLVLLAAALGAAACGTTSATTTGAPKSATSTKSSGVDVSLLRQQDLDYEPAKSPEALVKSRRHDVIATGTVEAIEQGREILLEEGDTYPLTHVVMRVRVTDKLRASSADQVKDGRVYVELWQGGRYNDKAGTPVHSLSEWRRSIPAGTPVMLFLSKDQAEGTMRGKTNGLAPGAKLMTPDAQGIVFQDGGRLIGGIEDLQGEWAQIKTLNQLRDRVKAQLRKD
ncbi:hypothetical protein [Actinomadura alba]|uniref:Lipoprotein n=1 Tax=Actinomadura alba TaxID=406431 RepID=A0ABR7LKA7_9ACTN|nr:hypothetical protein [Actinomadura alba]MBC6464907.1 hypothetical protein [Actinomadura alba]